MVGQEWEGRADSNCRAAVTTVLFFLLNYYPRDARLGHKYQGYDNGDCRDRQVPAPEQSMTTLADLLISIAPDPLGARMVA